MMMISPGENRLGQTPGNPFRSFMMGGFECSYQCLPSGRRVDVVASTLHEIFALLDYKRLQNLGICVAREGLRWHLVEQRPGHYDFSSAAPIVQAARVTGTQVIWDLCHFGWPDHLDIFSSAFISSLQDYAQAFAKWLQDQMGEPGFFVPVNEISFFSWAGGDVASFNPFATGRGSELKAQLVRASIAAMNSIRRATPAARFVLIDPIIHVVAAPKRPEEQPEAEAYRLSQYQAWDMIAGKAAPELGGTPDHLDIVGVNFYPHNEWYYNLKEGTRRIRKFTPILRNNPLYRPFRYMLQEVYQRYQRPIIVAETGAELRLRAGWFRYVCQEVAAALHLGVPVHGICLYPIVNHPGWVDNRHCHNALWDYADQHGQRKIYAPLAREIRGAQKMFKKQKAEFLAA